MAFHCPNPSCPSRKKLFGNHRGLTLHLLKSSECKAMSLEHHNKHLLNQEKEQKHQAVPINATFCQF
jgi:hypothetical protein